MHTRRLTDNQDEQPSFSRLRPLWCGADSREDIVRTHTQMWSAGKPGAYLLYPWAEFERLRQFCSVTIVALSWLAWRYLADTHSQMWSAQGNLLQISLPIAIGCAGPFRVLPLWSRGDQLKGIWRTHRCGARWNRWWKWRCPLCGYHVSMWGGWGGRGYVKWYWELWWWGVYGLLHSWWYKGGHLGTLMPPCFLATLQDRVFLSWRYIYSDLNMLVLVILRKEIN